MLNAYNTYNEVGVSTSNPVKLILMLYDGAINFLNMAIDYAEKGDVKNKSIYANQALDIIDELNNSLDLESGGELARNLRRLYFFMSRHLMQSNWKSDPQGFTEVIELLSNLREAWKDISSRNTATKTSSALSMVGIRA